VGGVLDRVYLGCALRRTIERPCTEQRGTGLRAVGGCSLGRRRRTESDRGDRAEGAERAQRGIATGFCPLGPAISSGHRYFPRELVSDPRHESQRRVAVKNVVHVVYVDNGTGVTVVVMPDRDNPVISS